MQSVLRFRPALQKLCDEHNVKLMTGLIREQDGTTRATLTAFKLDDAGKCAGEADIPSISPKREAVKII